MIMGCAEATWTSGKPWALQDLPLPRGCLGRQELSIPELWLTQTRWTSLQVRVEASQAQ